MAKIEVYAVLPNQSLAKMVQDSISSDYALTIESSLDNAVAGITQSQPSIILCEQSLLEPDLAVVLASFKTACATSRILAIGESRTIETQVAGLKHGARGYFDTALPMATLNAALGGIMRGEVWVERHVISELIDELVLVPEITEQQRKTIESLSPKELEVAQLVSQGATNKMIAHQMSITERTVKAHLTATFQKLNIPDRLALAIFFRDLR